MSLAARRRQRDEATAFVAERVAAEAGAARFTRITVPAPLVPLECVLALAPDDDAMLWDPRDGVRAVGLGVAARVSGSGSDRFAHIAQAGAELLDRVSCHWYPDTPQRLPRLWGGFAFAAGGADTAPWTDFGDADFVLPRWVYETNDEGAFLSVCITDDAERRTATDRVGAMLARLAESPAAYPSALPGPVHLEDPDRETWRDQVDSIRRAIHAGRCEKVVAARCTVATAGHVIDPLAVLGGLASRYADCHRFAFRRRAATFVGATPERLIRRAGRKVTTEALAGSIALPAGNPAALLASAKDRGEQDLVVRAIEDALAPRCAELDVPAEPHIRTLRHVLHLETPIEGTLRADDHVLALASRLHPTPAVGGVPVRTAMRWIETTEADARGWYAGPVGWFDASGDGELVVAIRSGLLTGRRAYVYAGAGIVRDSDADAELDETCVKQRAVLGSLGVRG